MSDTRPFNCRHRAQDEGRAYPRSSCAHCGKTITTGLGRECTFGASDPTPPPPSVGLVERLNREARDVRLAGYYAAERVMTEAAAALTALTAQSAQIAELTRERDDANTAVAHLQAQQASAEDGSLLRDMIARAEAAEAKVEALTKELPGTFKWDLLRERNEARSRIAALEKALAGAITPLEHASQCLDGVVSMDDEDTGKDGGSATCQAVKKTVDRALKNIRTILGSQT